ncbi:enoyl-CoA hydratase/isomerase family protein [Paraburkholderia oxyphila]|uniref:enoyl-CoA hydratase/isomerase family protein n=1 Tax=Paraburkholderia oxyphila TaxID=614212 RepID=UPI000489105C|nr:enoyl-CoA hydratase-related protein [Paraburkholderia oxyphila]
MESKITLTSSGDIAVVTMRNPEQANAIDIPLCDEFLRVLDDIRNTPRFRAVILQATGKIFSAGGNLAQILDGLEKADDSLEKLIDALHTVILSIRRLPIPVIASVQGAAAGAGFSLAMACDWVVASRSARFVVGYAQLGTSSDGGLSFHLARRLGSARALQILLASGALSADEAGASGLVQYVTDPSSLESDTLALARKVIETPGAAVREFKSLVGEASESGLEQHLEREKQAFLRCALTDEFRQRVTDFVGRSNLGKVPLK